MSENEPGKNNRRHQQIEINKLDNEKKSSLFNRIIIALAALGVVIPCVILGGYFFFALVAVVALLGIYEFVHAPKKRYRWYVYGIVYILTLSFIYWGIIKWNVGSFINNQENFVFSLENNYQSLTVSIYGIIIELGLLFFCAVAHEDFTIHDIGYLFAMSLLLGVGMQSVLYVRYYPFVSFASTGVDTTAASFRFWASVVFFFYVELTTMLTDTWAYFVGIFFGKHKMNPRISPKKTWEGFFGGWILGGLSGLAFAMINDACGFPLLPSMAIFGENSHWWWAVLLSFTIPLVSTLGDLSFSFIKRHFEIKDFSHLLGAHGGILDRIDSIVFSTIFAAVMAVFVEGGWKLFG